MNFPPPGTFIFNKDDTSKRRNNQAQRVFLPLQGGALGIIYKHPVPMCNTMHRYLPNNMSSSRGQYREYFRMFQF